MRAEVRYFVIYGVTESGSAFRPSDWAERLAGVLAPYRPAGTLGGYISYSPYARLRDLEPLAWQFVHDFARDNQLKTQADLPDDPLVRAK
jgi:Protein of unknown function (DUF3579)